MLKTTLFAGAALLLLGAGAANAADVIDVAPVSDWTGFYVGVHAGYGWGNFDFPTTYTFDVLGANEDYDFGDDLDADGFFAGLQAGFNWQFDSFLLGVEADISKSWIGGDGSTAVVGVPGLGDGVIEADADLDWFGTARLRGGFLLTPELLLYATGGLAWGSVETDIAADFDNDALDWSDGDSSSHMGWTLGAGLEYAMTEAVSLKLEYLYIDLGKEDVLSIDRFGNAFEVEQDIDVHTVRAGLNFHF